MRAAERPAAADRAGAGDAAFITDLGCWADSRPLGRLTTTTETRTSSGFDSQKADAFAGRMLSALNNGAFCLMASIGHRTGLFDVMRDQGRWLRTRSPSRRG